MTANIIRYNFKTKEKIETYSKKAWQCSVCYLTYSYDSRKDKDIPVLVQNGNDFYCEECINKMKTIVDIQKERRKD